MSDLISRKVLYEEIAKLEELARDRVLDTPSTSPCYARYSAQLNERTSLKHIIANAPTAYDVDKIVKEIKGMSGIQFDGGNESYELNWCISTYRAIEIVKGGGVDE